MRVPDLSTPLRELLGGKTVKALEAGLDMRTAGDLLRHYPRRYAERGVLAPLSDVREGDYITVQAEIVKVSERQMRQRRGKLVEVVVSDGRGTLKLTFFNQGWRSR